MGKQITFAQARRILSGALELVRAAQAQARVSYPIQMPGYTVLGHTSRKVRHARGFNKAVAQATTRDPLLLDEAARLIVHPRWLRDLGLDDLEDLELSVRSANVLDAANVKTVGALIRRLPAEVQAFRNSGKKVVREIAALLGELGLVLKGEPGPQLLWISLDAGGKPNQPIYVLDGKGVVERTSVGKLSTQALVFGSERTIRSAARLRKDGVWIVGSPRRPL